jgi:hypothetical protein
MYCFAKLDKASHFFKNFIILSILTGSGYGFYYYSFIKER